MIKTIFSLIMVGMGLVALHHQVEYAGWVLTLGLLSWAFSDPCDCD